MIQKYMNLKVGLWIWIGLRIERLLEQVINFQNLANVDAKVNLQTQRANT